MTRHIPIAEPKWRPIPNRSTQRTGSESATIYLTKFFDFRSGAEVYEVIEVCPGCHTHNGGLSRGHVLATGMPGTAGLRDILPKVLEMSPECEGVREVLGHILYLIGVTTKYIDKGWLDD